MTAPKVEVVADSTDLAAVVAHAIAEALRAAVDERGRAVLALSGGRTPAPMFDMLGRADLPWDVLDVVQVDERVVPDGDPARNIAAIAAALVDGGRLPAERLHPMEVAGPDLAVEIARYGGLLGSLTGGAPTAGPASSPPPAIDVVHLGIGADGHTASLVPGDPVLEVTDEWVSLAGPYQGTMRLTLTAPVLSAARRVVWMVAGSDKAAALASLIGGDRSVPAGLVATDDAIVFADRAAMAAVE